MEEVSALGLIAACLTTGAYFPQALKSWRSRSTEDISLITVIALVTGQLLWLIYGVTIADVPLMMANAISASLTGLILYVKIQDVRQS